MQDVRYSSKILGCSIPTYSTDLEIKVTDLEFFIINEMSISRQSAIRKHWCSKYKNHGGSASIPKLLTPGYMPWGGAAGQNIEHPHTLRVILSSFFLLRTSNTIVTVMILSFRTGLGKQCRPRSDWGATVYQGLHCLLFPLHPSLCILGCITLQ